MADLLGESALSERGASSQVVSLLIFIFTGVAANVLVLSGSQVDTFLILLMALFLWLIMRSAMVAVSDAITIANVTQTSLVNSKRWKTPGTFSSQEDEGWNETWITGMEFVSRILVLLTFQVAGGLILQEWTLVGVTTQETLVLLFLIAILFFPVFLWIHRTWKMHNASEREAFRQAMAAAAATAPKNHM